MNNHLSLKKITATHFLSLNLSQKDCDNLLAFVNGIFSQTHEPLIAWQKILEKNTAYSFAIYQTIFQFLFPNWPSHLASAPVYFPDEKTITSANLTRVIQEGGFDNLQNFYQWSWQHPLLFWEKVINILNIPFFTLPNAIADFSQGLSKPHWLPGAKMNIACACFQAPAQATAIIYTDKDGNLVHFSYQALDQLSNQIAASLIKLGFQANDAIAIIMPMNHFAVAIYLGIIKMGATVVSIADSFSEEEICIRLSTAKCAGIFTQDFTQWMQKKIPIYDKVKTATARYQPVPIIVLPLDFEQAITLDSPAIAWSTFLIEATFSPVPQDPMNACNILFSSGTTAAPKAIIWNHTTAIKAASDAFFHHNIQAGDILAWPTNLGWMMGPWLIFAALMNHAAIALYTEAPKDRAFGEFIQAAGVTMLGVVPTLVAAWRESGCMEDLNWQKIKLFSSTGECSNPENMFYLMWLAKFKPVIEYCGGTEIGGAYLSSTVIEPNYPALFTTPTMGLHFAMLDESGVPYDMDSFANRQIVGEVAIMPPSIGLSTQLLNADHEAVYYEHMPIYQGRPLRRHGDLIQRLGDCYSILGRADDTMNLGGIKISAAEIERSVISVPHLIECAAVAISPKERGPNQLIIFAKAALTLDPLETKRAMQKQINQHLNPLFKIHDLIFVEELPKTASNKIMRRTLREIYQNTINNK